MTWFDLLCQEHPGIASLLILIVFIISFVLLFVLDVPEKIFSWLFDNDDDDNDKPDDTGAYNIFD